MRGLLFYLAAAAIAAAMIVTSLGPRAWAPKSAPQVGVIDRGWLVFGPKALSRAEIGAGARLFVTKDERGAPTALRVATRRTEPDGGGARLMFAPEAAAELGAGPWRVEVTVSPIGATTADDLRVGAIGPETTRWSAPQTAPTETVTLAFSLEGGGEALSGLAFRPQSTRKDFDFGVEITQVRVRPGA